MDRRVLNNIIEYEMIKSGENVVVGVSGGPDSMALLYSLIKASESIGFTIITAHVNHGVRGEEALQDELFVERISRDLNLQYYSRRVDMVAYGREKGITAEEAGRELRYGFFREILKKHGGGSIAVAHNKNDQAETLIMRMMRGTGIDGLKGMEFKVGDVIRPILNINRMEIEQYIENNSIETRLDKTNLMPIYSRNKVRLELIPYIEENFNPNIINSLWRMSQISNLDSNFLEEFAKEKYNRIVKSEKRDRIVLDKNLILKEHKSIQQRILRISLEKIALTLQGFTEQHISSINELLYSGTGKELNLPHNLIVKMSYDDLIIEKKLNRDVMEYIYNLNIGNNKVTDLNYTFNLEIIDINDVNKINMGKYTKCFDYDKLKGELSIRNRRPGDRFVPFGMKGNKKLKDYFIDEKINLDLRKEIPLLIDDENIIWVIGYRTSDLYKLTKETKKVLLVDVKLVDI